MSSSIVHAIEISQFNAKHVEPSASRMDLNEPENVWHAHNVLAGIEHGSEP